jgi:hypothetical protein
VPPLVRGVAGENLFKIRGDGTPDPTGASHSVKEKERGFFRGNRAPVPLKKIQDHIDHSF